MYEFRTDLALENTEKYKSDNVEIEGVIVKESYEEELDLTVTVVEIVDEHGEQMMRKPQGTYVTLESSYLLIDNSEMHEKIAKVLCENLKKLLAHKSIKSVLVVGLGNREITPDALGPATVDHLYINRHLVQLKEDKESQIVLSSLAPGVMAQTGMETTEIVRGVVKETNPDVMLVVDALASRSMYRLNRTIQIANTGINPGSGVKNHRLGLNQDIMGIPVIAIGVPTVVDAAAIVYDAVNGLIDKEQSAKVMEEIITQELHQLFVTTKDVDEAILMLGVLIAKAINLILE